MKIKFSQTILEKSSNITLHENPPSEFRVGPSDEQIDRHTDRQTYMATVTIAFHKFANVPKSQYNTAFTELERPCQQIQKWQANG